MDEKFAALSKEHSAERKELLEQFDTKYEQLEKNFMSMKVQSTIGYLCLSKFCFIENVK